MAAAGFEPDVDNVHFLYKLGIATLWTFHPGWNKLLRLMLIPCVGTVTREEINNTRINFL